MSTEGAASEIGRELSVDELEARKVVVIAPPGHPELAITMWVHAVGVEVVIFYSGVHKVHVVNYRHADGTLRDDQGRVVRVFEYLGEP